MFDGVSFFQYRVHQATNATALQLMRGFPLAFFLAKRICLFRVAFARGKSHYAASREL